MTKPVVVLTEEIDPAALAWLAGRCEVVRCDAGERAALGRAMARAAGLVVRTYTRVDSALLEAAPGLKCVARAGVGLDNIDVAECRRRGVEVVHTPDANTQAVAEYVLGLMLDALRARVSVERAMEAREWERVRREAIAPRQLSELTLGILGLGRVGKRVAKVAGAVGMGVVYHDIVEIDPAHRHGAVEVSLDELLARSDVLSVHVDARESNRGFLGAVRMGRLKSGVLLINTSRGMVVDAGALAEFLRGHPGARAALDVHEPEPVDAGYPLLGVANARLLPHLGAATRAAHEAMSWVVRDLWRVLNGEKPEHAAP